MNDIQNTRRTEDRQYFLRHNSDFINHVQTCSIENRDCTICGYMSSKYDPQRKYFFKYSKNTDFLIENEFVTGSHLNSIVPYCPHFCIVHGMFDYNTKTINNSLSANNDVFSSRNHAVEKSFLVNEKLDGHVSLLNMIQDDKIDEQVIIQVIKQTLLCLYISQCKLQFSHNDLHPDNILVQKCDPNDVFLYVLDDDNQVLVPTYGYYPVIIDFEYSFTSRHNYLFASTSHKSYGITPWKFKWYTDPIRLLISSSFRMCKRKDASVFKLFRKLVRNMFGHLNVSMTSGFPQRKVNHKKQEPLYKMAKFIHKFTTSQMSITYKYSIRSTRLIQSLIDLPISYSNDTSDRDMEMAVQLFSTEFVKIERQFSSLEFRLFLLKFIVNTTRQFKQSYINSNFKNEVTERFRQTITTKLDSIAKFVVLKCVNFETMMCSLLVMADFMSNILYNDQSNDNYTFRFHDLTHVYGLIETNIPDHYEYNENTVVHIINNITESIHIINIPTLLVPTLNNNHSIINGSYVYDWFTTNR